MFETLVETIRNFGILPVLTIHEEKGCKALAEALIQGGLPVVEITFRTAIAPRIIRTLTNMPHPILVGAGTVLTLEQAEEAHKAGAAFIVMPAFNEQVIQYCLSHQFLPIPGISGPSEIEKGLSLKLPLLKFFPAEANGGLKAIKALCGPYRNVDFIPTGGISDLNFVDYLDFDRVAAVGGSFGLNEYIAQENWSEVAAKCSMLVRRMLGMTIAHLGINSTNEVEAQGFADAFSDLLFLPIKEGRSSIFVQKDIEVMKEPFYGEKGHLAIRVRSLSRAVRYLTARGTEFRSETKICDSSGRMKAIYLEKEIAGFAIHLVQDDII